MAFSLMVTPGIWWQVGEGLWVYVQPLDDPLLCATEHRVDVHQQHGMTWLRVAGNNAGVRVAPAPGDQDVPLVDGDPR